MKICGFQPLTLLDYPNHLAANIFTGGCNFRCHFCHNASLVTDVSSQPSLDIEYVLTKLKQRAHLIEGVCITGGEPCIHSDLIDLIVKIKDLGLKVKLDTNGSYPSTILNLITNDLLDYVAMDIKSSLNMYPHITGVSYINTNNILKTISILLSSNIDYEFRTTVVSEFHNEVEMLKIKELIADAPSYYLQLFKDSGNTISSGFHPCSQDDMLYFRNIFMDSISNVEIRGFDFI